MRITGGRAKGVPLRAPKQGTRPATDYLREAVFSSLGMLVEGQTALDLFAGTGAYGLEALSRGAKRVTLLEKHPATLKLAESNTAAVLKSLQAEPGSVGCVQSDVFRWQVGQRYGVIFADPPYALLETHGEALLELCTDWLAKEETARLVLEGPGDYEPVPPPGLRLLKRLGKGHKQPSALIFARTQTQ